MFIAIDGDTVGKKLEQFILEGDKEELRNFSQSIKKFILELQQFIENNQGNICMCGGDNLFAECPRGTIETIVDYVRSFNENSKICFSVAAGETMQDTYIALNYAKSSQKHYIEARREGEIIEFLIMED